MQSINFNSENYKEYAINGDESKTIRINVSDVGIITRLQDAVRKADIYCPAGKQAAQHVY